jgi:cytochrome c
MPDGTGLPPGSGTPAQGKTLFADNCAFFWPVATTLFDFIRRAMPFTQPRTLTDDQVYALSAYLLYMNKVISEADRMDATSLPKVKMPNRDSFFPEFPKLTPSQP